MKLVCVEALGRRVSSVGFGCASLGGRIGLRKGLEALERAYEAGITWYDVAPSYGDAMAESILGEFASKKRDSIYVCTKVGMRPGDTPAAVRLLKPMVRIVVATFPALQKQVSRVRPKPFKVPLSAELIRTSVEESLRRLRTDYVDVLALHRPAVEEVVREDIILALERVVRDGKARAVSIAGNLEAGMKGLDESLPYRLVQIANNSLEPDLAKLKERARPGRTFVTYGSFSSLDRLVTRINAQKEILNALSRTWVPWQGRAAGEVTRGAAKRRNKSNPWFKRGTLFRSAVDVMRRAAVPMTAREIAETPDSWQGPRGLPEAVQRPSGGYPCCTAEAGWRNVVGAGAPARWSLRVSPSD
jgi:aryl-alcohol dehydrogenase-like predicted oxidoreductase